MKKIFLFLLLIAGGYAFAQTGQPAKPTVNKVSLEPSLRLNGFATYAFDDNHVDSYYSNTSYFDGSIKGGFEYGGSLEFLPGPFYGIELTYLRLDSKAPMTYYNNGEVHTDFDLATNWIFLGGNRYLPVNPKVEPYAGAMVGMAIFNVANPDNGRSDNATKFAWGIKAGLNVWASEKVGIKIQTSLLSAVQAVGGGLYFGTGGAGAGVSGFSTFYQFVVGGGLTFKIGPK